MANSDGLIRTGMVSRRKFLQGSGLLLLANTLPSRSLLAASGQDVIVVGAGMAGIAAAHQLKTAGCNVRILEARDRIGGRIHTDNSLGLPLDLGAAWIHGIQGNPLTSLAAQFGISTINTDEFNQAIFNPRGKLLKRKQLKRARKSYRQVLKKARQSAEERDTDIALQTAFNQEYFRLPKKTRRKYGKIISWLLRSEVTEDIAADPSHISTWWLGEDEEFDGPEVMPVGGYTQMLESLLADRSLSVELNSQVLNIDYSASGVVVQTASETITADKVVVTIPLGVLQAGGIGFTPALPSEKSTAIQSLAMGVSNKLIMRFSENFWSGNQDKLFGFIGNASKNNGSRQEITEFFDLSYVSQQPILIAFTGGDLGIEVEQLSSEERIAHAMTPLQRIFGRDASLPTDTIPTNWYSDPFARGAYSFIPVNGKPKDYDTVAASLESKVFFAGEGTNRSYPATVHGAYLSGIRAAKELLES